ncbi:MAG: hypothetical protein JEZ00_13865 [Anaerolineaceae bacterium]|nr:hypothetical protein [Anaerolineaceae bacterium]
MEIINISGLELIVVAVIALILLGPEGTMKFMREAGRLIRKVVRSPIWKDIMSTSKEIRSFPEKIVKEVDLEEELKEFEAWRAETKGLQNSLNKIESELNIKPADVIKSGILDQPVEEISNEKPE